MRPRFSREPYSNTNSVVLGLVVRAVTGRPGQTELDERMSKPLKLDSTFYPIEQRIPGRHARGYFVPEPGTRLDITEISPTRWRRRLDRVHCPEVALYRALCSGRLVRSDLVRDMRTMTDGYGLGVIPRRVPAAELGLLYGQRHDSGE